MSAVAVPFAVLAIGGSSADIGYVTAAGLLPTVVFLLLGGVVADRVPRQQVMTYANMVQAGAQFAFAGLVSSHAPMWSLAAAIAVRGSAYGFYQPAARGLLPHTVPPDQLAAANAWDRLGFNTAQIGGAALGGISIAVLGVSTTIAVDAVTFLIAGLLRWWVRIANLPPAVSAGMLNDLADGWRAVRSRRWLWLTIVVGSVVGAVFIAVVHVLGPGYAARELNGAGAWGAVIAAQALGAAAGAGWMLKWRPSRLLIATAAGMLLLALLPVTMLVGSVVGYVVAASFLAGVGLEVSSINCAIALQQRIPSEHLSRVSSFDAFGTYALVPVALAMTGPIAEAVGDRATLAGAAIALTLLPLGMMLDPAVTRLRRTPVAASSTN